MPKSAAIETVAEAERAPVVISPANVILNADGFAFRSIMVRLPETAVLDDLKEPKIWAKVQSSRLPLRRHDQLYIVAFDERWIAEAIVADANGSQAVLTTPRATRFPDRFEQLFQDELYRVTWTGAGYRVQRKKDGALVTPMRSLAAHAERDLLNLHPLPAGA